MFTGVIGSPVVNLTKRIGAFDANNGVFFELSGSTLNVGIRKGASDTKVAQDSWNIDKLDGTGVSGLTLDISKAQIFVVDYEWLGVGRVRFGFVINGNIYYCHQSLHANIATSVYMSTPNLPVRYEIVSTGGVGSLQQICCSVMSEGGLEPLGILRSTSTDFTHLNADNAGTFYACLGVRLRSTRLDATVIPINFSAFCVTTDAYQWILSMNPTVAGTFNYSDLTNSVCQVAKGVTANTISDLGVILSQGFSGISDRSVSANLTNALRIGSTIAGVSDTLVLSFQPLSASADIFASLVWRELN